MEDNKIQCQLCNKECNSWKGLSTHLRYSHTISSQQYFDIFLAEPNSGICPNCGKQTRFKNLSLGYHKFCSHDCSVKSQETIQKSKNTLKANYGELGLKHPKIRSKSIQTSIERWGTENPAQSEVVKNRIKETVINTYGVEYAFQSEEVKEKIKQTNLERRGVEYSSQAIDVRQKLSKAMKNGGLEKQRSTVLKNWGVEHISQSIEIKKRKNQSYRKNNTFKSSKPEDSIYQKLIELYSDKDIIRNYRENRYPFNCDFYIKSRDLFIECNFHWTHDSHWFNENSSEDKKKLDELYKKAQNSNYYKQKIKVWTYYDYNKRRMAQKYKLKYVVFWDELDFDSWVLLDMPIKYDWKNYDWRNDDERS